MKGPFNTAGFASVNGSGNVVPYDAGTQINSNGGSVSLQADKMQLLGSINATSSGVVKLAPQAGTAAFGVSKTGGVCAAKGEARTAITKVNLRIGRP